MRLSCQVHYVDFALRFLVTTWVSSSSSSSLSQVVLRNGQMAMNFEHSFSDGMDWTRMLGEVRSPRRGAVRCGAFDVLSSGEWVDKKLKHAKLQ